jgi:cAMP-binding proteins - catabolite gene activator and regulatory subunit of cAMP-dependent protein kinases
VTQKLVVPAERHASGSPTDGCFACDCKPSSIFGDLDAESLIALDRRRQASTYPAGATVFLQGDQPRAIYCVGTGRVKLSHGSEDGRSIALGIAVPGDVMGVRPMLLGTPHDLNAETLEETRLCFIPKDDFLEFLARNGAVSLRLAQKLSAELDEAYRHLSGAVLKSTTQRLAELILALCQTQGQPGREGINLPTSMCQDELAEFLGVSRRSLSRAFATLRNRGLIECRRRLIVVRDRAALSKSLGSLSGLHALPSRSVQGRVPTRHMAHS